ncbi:MAG TPA: ABC transporter ATP-binding protein [Aggregatilineales bacterium]|jgi:ABC-type lipoprotein export system ATPase subunit|nr:ABC transporter ATP-binding protein [Aggregatilineales bacterium]
MAFIECDNLMKIYKVADLEVVALQGLNLTVEQGEMIALIGPSGSGKSTLMNVLGGLDVPSAGRVTVGDFRLNALNRRQQVQYRRDVIGFVWQQTAHNLLPYLSVRENVELPMAFAGVKPSERRRRASELLEAVDVTARMDARAAHLSGGEQQRVALAVAMANQPQLLLADEPTGEIDSAAADRIFDTMRTLNETYGVTIVIVTHDYAVSKRVSRVVGMRDGRASIEVLRQKNGSGVPLTEEEFTVIDRTGRLQLPQGYVERLRLQNLVRLHLADDHVAVYPVEQGEA